MFNVMEGIGLGLVARVYFKETDNETNGDITLVSNQWSDYYLKFKKGTYSITFAYQFIPSSNAYPTKSTPISTCTASSYFMDFPLEKTGISGDRARIHNVAYHTPGNKGHHGGAISYVIKVEQDDYYWMIKLGCGQSGYNCLDTNNKAVAGYSLVNDNTFVLASRIGD